MEKKTLHIYCRVNPGAQDKKQVLFTQQYAGKKKAQELGYNYKFLIEESLPASEAFIPPVLNELLENADRGRITDVFITDIDRFTRSPKLMINLANRLHAANVVIHMPRNDRWYDSDQEFRAEIKRLMATYEATIRKYRQAKVRK